MWKKRKQSSGKQGGTDYWQSYSDMMAALLLMFVLIMALTMLQSLRTFEEKNADLERQRITIEEQREALKIQEENLEKVKGDLNELTKIVGVKSDIIAALKEEFSGSELTVNVDEQTGAITFDTGIFFAYGSAYIQQAGEAFLNTFVPQYLSVLLSEEYKDYVAEIIIEGHTDLDGTYMMNLGLSQQRALAVAQFCLEWNNSLTDDQTNTLRKILTANGRSFSNPVYDQDGNVDAQASRRVVFKFRLKDEEMVSAIQDLLGDRND